EQGFCLLSIKVRRLVGELLAVALDRGWKGGVDRLGKAAVEDRGDDLVAIDGVGDGLAYRQLRELRSVHVQAEIGNAARLACIDLEAVVVLEARHVRCR